MPEPTITISGVRGEDIDLFESDALIADTLALLTLLAESLEQVRSTDPPEQHLDCKARWRTLRLLARRLSEPVEQARKLVKSFASEEVERCAEQQAGDIRSTLS